MQYKIFFFIFCFIAGQPLLAQDFSDEEIDVFSKIIMEYNDYAITCFEDRHCNEDTTIYHLPDVIEFFGINKNIVYGNYDKYERVKNLHGNFLLMLIVSYKKENKQFTFSKFMEDNKIEFQKSRENTQ